MDLIAKLNQIFQDSSTKAEAYKNMLKYLHRAVNNIDISYNLEFREKYQIDEENPMRFDETFFDWNGYDEFYILFGAKLNHEVYRALEHAYNLTHDDKFSQKALEDRLTDLSKTSTPNLPYYFKTVDDEGKDVMYKRKSHQIDSKGTFEIENVTAEKLSPREYSLNLFIDFYDFYERFTVKTSKVKEVEDALKTFSLKSHDLLFMIVAENIIDEIRSRYEQYYDKQNDIEENTLDKIKKLAETQKESPNIYKDLMIFIRDQANQYLPEWTSYYILNLQKKNNNSGVIDLDNEFYQKDGNAEILALSFASGNGKVYDWVEYAWNISHEEIFSGKILNREINFLKEKGLQ